MKGHILCLVFCFVVFSTKYTQTTGILYPFDSETREVKSLDGVWNFVKSNRTAPNEGTEQKWYLNDLSKVHKTMPMPVPSSFNDITEDADLRDHVGTVWYDRKFFVSADWAQNKRVWIRFGSVNYEAHVYINGKLVVKHKIGHLPFQADVTDALKYDGENRITVMCDNTLHADTIPQGAVREVASDDNKTTIIQTYTFDFFNYAGIHRSVVLYTTPKVHISDIYTLTNITENKGRLFYQIETDKTADSTDSTKLNVTVNLLDREGNVVFVSKSPENSLKGTIIIENVKPWWPYLMHPDPGYLYTMEVLLSTNTKKDIDIYRLKVGFRTLQWDTNQFLINDKPIYFRGVGRHEDSDIRGRGFDMALLTKDFNLMKWLGANSYRTSHYPYSEESMQFADEHGIMVIDECSGVNIDDFSTALLENHKTSIKELINRDWNHPSVVMWSISNEARSSKDHADIYFGAVANFTKTMDPYRPITAPMIAYPRDDKESQWVDIVSFNRYNGWYANPGQLDMVKSKVMEEAIGWRTKHNRPVLMSEYGADTLEGLHLQPSAVWSEEYQKEVFSKHFEAFDILRSEGWFIGEFPWNFADFKTGQEPRRVGGNKKGLFTRSRQPKEVAHHIRKRYHLLSEKLDKTKLPEDLFPYLISGGQSSGNRTEL